MAMRSHATSSHILPMHMQVVLCCWPAQASDTVFLSLGIVNRPLSDLLPTLPSWTPKHPLLAGIEQHIAHLCAPLGFHKVRRHESALVPVRQAWRVCPSEQRPSSYSGQLVIQVRIASRGSVSLGAGRSWAELMDVGLSGQGDEAVAVVRGRSGFQNRQCPTIPGPPSRWRRCRVVPSVACLT